MNKVEKIGIFGGTFNPPHIGHVSALRAFVSAISPDKTLVIPDNLPPHKEYSGSVSPTQRLDMCRIAFSDIETVEISDAEIKRGGRSYTVETLRALTSSNREIYFLCGTDMLLSLDTWSKAEEIFKLAHIACVRRENDEKAEKLILEKKKEYETKFNAKIVLVSSAAVEVSSTEIRSALRARISNQQLIPNAVMRYILDKELYLCFSRRSAVLPCCWPVVKAAV